MSKVIEYYTLNPSLHSRVIFTGTHHECCVYMKNWFMTQAPMSKLDIKLEKGNE